jgi:hypothetical protein
MNQSIDQSIDRFGDAPLLSSSWQMMVAFQEFDMIWVNISYFPSLPSTSLSG